LIRALRATGSDVVWDGVDGSGRLVGRGVYYCRLRSGGSCVSEKLVKVD
jgi:hypothetical protein